MSSKIKAGVSKFWREMSKTGKSKEFKDESLMQKAEAKREMRRLKRLAIRNKNNGNASSN